MFQIVEEGKGDVDLHNNIQEILQPAYTGDLLLPAAELLVRNVNEKEIILRNRLMEFLRDEKIAALINDEQKKSIAAYIASTPVYLIEKVGFNNPDLEKLQEILKILVQVAVDRSFKIKKQVVESQLELL